MSESESLPISARAMAPPPYLEGLNPEQRQAVETLDGPVLVLSGAGTGKTRVLIARLAHLLSTRRARPWEILSVTFTNKAAREMRDRVERLLGPGAGALEWLGTFHSISAKMLRRHAELVGLKSSFTILDTDDQIRLLKQVIDAVGLDEKRWSARHLAGLIDSWKNRALSPDRVPPGESASFAEGRGAALYATYQQRLKALNACDFGDLLLHMIGIFQNHPDLLAEYHRKLRYLMVDEYQDANVAQYLWLRLLAQGSHNLCVVGDDDQSIYGWRGAEVDNILRFERDFPGAKVVRLERNYRSTGHILGAASGLIAANQARLGKTLWTEADGGDRVRVRGVWDGEAEARLVADDIEAWLANSSPSEPHTHADAAVLVRAAWQMRAFEERFLMLKIPYKVIGGPRFFERAEVRDAHAYLRLLRSPEDDLAFERVVNMPKRGVGDTSVAKLHEIARALNAPLTRAAREAAGTDEIRGPARAGLNRFLNQLDAWRRRTQEVSHVELAEIILEESGYTDMLRADKSPQAQTRLENLKELVQAMGQFDSLAAYLEHVELVLDVDTGGGGDEVHLSTLHAAKGLEWKLVFLPGWEEEVFPSRRSIEENGVKALEEERRLAYVGLTRARESARISFAANRQIYGRWQTVLPSRFVDELPEKHVDAMSETGYAPGLRESAPTRFDQGDAARPGYESPGWRRASERGWRAEVIEGRARVLPPREGAPGGAGIGAEPRFSTGVRIFHDKFGYGRVIAVDGDKLTIAFEKAGEKRVIDRFVKPADAA